MSSSTIRPKAKSTDILKYNAVGLSLARIGKDLGCHPSTVTLRLNNLGVKPADTRRSFMEDVYDGLSSSQQDWLTDQVGPHTPVKDLVRSLIVDEFVRDSKTQEDPA